MRVIPLEAVDPGRPAKVTVKGQSILIATHDGIPYAIRDTCPHNGASLSDGVLRDGVITCPAHFWRFSILDGRRQSGPAVHVPTYPCWIEDGWIAIEVPDPEPHRSMREILLEHARSAPSAGARHA